MRYKLKNCENCENIFEDEFEVKEIVKKVFNHTDYIEKKLNKFDGNYEIREKSGPTYKSGVYFEKVFFDFHTNMMGFIHYNAGDSIKNYYVDIETGEMRNPQRIIKTQVPYRSTLQNVYESKNLDFPFKKYSKTESVLYVKDARPTDVFPISSFNEDGSFHVRVEQKTQNVYGTAYKKNDATIPELYCGAPEKNVIFLMTGTYYTEDHYALAKYHAEKCMKEGVYGKKFDTRIVIMNEKEYYYWSLETFPIKNEKIQNDIC